VSSELARRIAFTLGALLLFRLGTYITVPGINPAVWAELMRAQDGSILSVFNVTSGGAVARLSIFALGILPYISAAVIIQLVAYFSARLRRLQSSGESGRRRLETYTRIFTFLMALLQSAGIASALADIDHVVVAPGPLFLVSVTLTMTGGTMFLIWLSRQITLRGLGNGVAILLCSGVVFELMNAGAMTYQLNRQGVVSGGLIGGLIGLMVVLALVATLMEKARRRERVAFGAGTGSTRRESYLSLKLNGAGTVPALVAAWVMALPLIPAGFADRSDPGVWTEVAQTLGPGRPLYFVGYGIAVFVLVYLYTSFVLDPDELAETLKRHGGVIPQVEPGEATAVHLDAVLSRTTLIGAIYFAAFCLTLAVVQTWLEVPFFLAGTSLLILVGTVLDLESQVQNLTNMSLGGLRE
jgi:preprotein translocase subunit SecY